MLHLSPYALYALSIAVAALSALLACYYSRSISKFAAGIAALAAALAFFTYIDFFRFFLLAFAIGGTAGWVLVSSSSGRGRHGANKRMERTRDVVHIGIGIAVILLFYFAEPITARLLMVVAFMALYTLNALIGSNFGAFRKSKAAKLLLGLERHGTRYGEGATMLALGALLTASLICPRGYIEFAFVALFIGDPAATFIGTKLSRPKLPYAKSKSVAGTAAFFAATAAIGYLFISWYSVPFALVLTFIESIEIRVDDNILISAGAIALYAFSTLL